MKFSENQVVQVKSCDDIKKTLDRDGGIDGVVFASGMEEYCGLSVTVNVRRRHRSNTIYFMEQIPYSWVEEWLEVSKPIIRLPEDLFII